VDHAWDGPVVEFKQECSSCAELPKPDPQCKVCKGTGMWVCGEAVTCSKCGLDAMSHSLMTGP
jgi:hypothetical protein